VGALPLVGTLLAFLHVAVRPSQDVTVSPNPDERLDVSARIDRDGDV
jgi:hypothetical protein